MKIFLPSSEVELGAAINRKPELLPGEYDS
jgi:hypothetical protein